MVSLTSDLGLFILAWIGLTAGECPDEWTTYHGSCYKIIQNRKSWLDANAHCKSMSGSHLAELTTREEINFAEKEYTDRHLEDGVWIGLSDVLNTGVWTWIHAWTPAKETNWAPGQPGNYSQEDCVLINADSYWHKYPCTSLHYFMCEKRSRTPRPIIG